MRDLDQTQFEVGSSSNSSQVYGLQKPLIARSKVLTGENDEMRRQKLF